MNHQDRAYPTILHFTIVHHPDKWSTVALTDIQHEVTVTGMAPGANAKRKNWTVHNILIAPPLPEVLGGGARRQWAQVQALIEAQIEAETGFTARGVLRDNMENML